MLALADPIQAPHPMHIMIVEDEAIIAMTIESFLVDAGYDVVGIADDVESAIELARTQGVDLALVDMRLAHGASGRDVAAALKARGIPCLFATGNCPGDNQADLAIGCLHKPFSGTQVIQAVEVAAAVLRGEEVGKPPMEMHLY